MSNPSFSKFPTLMQMKIHHRESILVCPTFQNGISWRNNFIWRRMRHLLLISWKPWRVFSGTFEYTWLIIRKVLPQFTPKFCLLANVWRQNLRSRMQIFLGLLNFLQHRGFCIKVQHNALIEIMLNFFIIFGCVGCVPISYHSTRVDNVKTFKPNNTKKTHPPKFSEHFHKFGLNRAVEIICSPVWNLGIDILISSIASLSYHACVPFVNLLKYTKIILSHPSYF